MSLWALHPSVYPLSGGWHHHSALGYVAAAGVYNGAAVLFAVAMVAKIAPPDVIFGGFASLRILVGV